MPTPGSKLDHYSVMGLLRNNNLRSVWLAKEAITDRLVNIHVCLEAEHYNRIRFERSMSILSRLEHPVFARFIGSGYLDGAPYLVTEHVNGPSLAELLLQGGRMRELHSLRILHQIAEGFDQAWNRAGIIHRDLNPGSILIDLAAMRDDSQDLMVKVTDFGQALGKRLVDQFEFDLALEEEDFQRVAQSERVGSPPYMSPEQIRGRPLSASSDMYSLGATLFQLLVGAPPFAGDEEFVYKQHLQAPPPNLPGDISAGMRALVRRLLTKLPERRFDSWSEVRDEAAALIRIQDQRNRRRSTAEQQTTGIRYRRESKSYERTPSGRGIAPVIEPATESSHQSMASLVLALSRLTPSLSQPIRQEQPSPDSIKYGLRSADEGPMNTSLSVQAPVLALDQAQVAVLWSHLFRRADVLQAPVAAPVLGALMNSTTRSESTNVHAEAQLPDPPSPGSVKTPLPAPPLLDPQQGVIETEFPFGKDVRSGTEALLVREPTAIVVPSQVTPPMQAAGPSSPEVHASGSASEAWSVREAVLNALTSMLLNPLPTRDEKKSSGITKRITNRIKQMLGDRDQTLASIQIALARLDLDKALRLIEGLAETSGNDAQLCLLRSRHAGLAGSWEPMIDWAQQAIRQKIGEPTALALVALGNLYRDQDSIASVIACSVSDTYPEAPVGPICQAGIAMIRERTEEVTSFLETATGIDEDHPTLLLLQAAMGRNSGDVTRECSALHRLQHLYGQSPVITARLDLLAGR